MSHITDELLPLLRAGVKVTTDPGSASRSAFLLHDTGDHRTWRVGVHERAILRLLDGTRSLAGIQSALEQDQSLAGAERPTLRDIGDFVNQLAATGLLDYGAAAPPVRTRGGAGLLFRRVVTFPIRALLRWLVVVPWDLVSLQTHEDVMKPKHIRIGSPERLLRLLARPLRPLLGRPLVVIAILYSALGAALAIGHFDEWWHAVEILWNPWGIVVIAMIGILAVHVPHQVLHGVVLVHYGARVPSWGLRIVFNIIPTLWVDANDTAWLPERNARMSVMAAGLLWQSVAFATGVVGWLNASPRTFASLAFLALSSTALFGLILNVNPLARRDGYQLLSTWLQLDHLRERATSYLRAWVRWDPMPEPVSRRERRWFAVYSLAVNVFGIILTIGAALFALRLMHGYRENGATVVVFAVSFLFQDHFRLVFKSTGLRRAWRWLPRVVVWMLWIAAAAGVSWAMFLPFPYHAGGETTLAAVESADVRTELEGLIGTITVREGEWVEKGKMLALLHRQVQERNLYAAQATLAESKARQSALINGSRPEELEGKKAAVAAAEAQLEWSTARAVRYDPLFKQNVISLQEYENAKQLQLIDQRNLEQARAQLALTENGARDEAIEATEQGIKSQEAIVEHFRGNVERTAILSPISGYVTTPDIEHHEGLYLQPGQRDLVATIENTKVLVAGIDVPEEDISGVSIGSEVTLYTWSYPGREFQGKVTAIAPVASDDNPQKRSVVRVRTEIPNPDGTLKPKMTGYAKITIEHRPVWDVLFRPFLRWLRIEVWSWLP